MVIKAALILPALALPHCAFLPQPDLSVSRGIPCDVGAPPLNPGDQLSDPTGRWMVTILRSGKAICGWQPPA